LTRKFLQPGVISPADSKPAWQEGGEKPVNKINVISVYTLEQAIADGVLVEIFKNQWLQLSGGKPIVATAHLFGEVSLAALLDIWNEYVYWTHTVRGTLPEEEQLFATPMNGKKVWVIEDEQACTLMYPEDY
jgi:hypothetical protein